MGVYIDIEMPRCCADCVFFVQLAGSDVTECVMPEGRGQWCPLEEADHKTENCSEKPNNFDKDINVRSKDEPQTNYVLSKDSEAYKFNKRMEVEEMWLKEQSGKE